MRMNEQFLEQMKELLGDEYSSYLNCLDKKSLRGFRVNTLKTTPEHLFSFLDISHSSSPFSDNGYYTEAPSGIGITPAYLSGAFYMQEPSASSAVTILAPDENMKILDLCAAPGSKTTQILEKLNNTGLLVSNEFDSKRSGILAENTERNGSANCVVLNADTNDVADAFEGYFDMVLCDAPCSGEGMMRKENVAVTQWSKGLVASCAKLQKEILKNAYRCLRAGGVLVYSTCTLNKNENEYQIAEFLSEHPDMHMEDANVSFGRKAFAEGMNTEKAIRIFPMDGGEGHFIARMRKGGASSEEKRLPLMKSAPLPKCATEFLDENLSKPYPYYFCHNDKVYGGTYPFFSAGRCRLIRHQTYLGEIRKNRFEPANGLFMSSYTRTKNKYEMTDNEAIKYIHGEQISGNVQKGWVSMCYHDLVLGGAKSDGTAMKNHFPKAFRVR